MIARIDHGRRLRGKKRTGRKSCSKQGCGPASPDPHPNTLALGQFCSCFYTLQYFHARAHRNRHCWPQRTSAVGSCLDSSYFRRCRQWLMAISKQKSSVPLRLPSIDLGSKQRAPIRVCVLNAHYTLMVMCSLCRLRREQSKCTSASAVRDRGCICMIPVGQRFTLRRSRETIPSLLTVLTPI